MGPAGGTLAAVSQVTPTSVSENRRVSRWIKAIAPVLTLAGAMLVFLALAPDRPITLLDAQTILLQASIVCVVSLGMTLVIVSGGIDLSVGSGVALCGIAAAEIMGRGPDSGPGASWQPLVAIVGACAVGVMCGLYNGLLVTLLRLPPFIATLGTLGFFRGLAKWASGSSPVYTRAGWLATWVQPQPTPAWLIMAPAVWMMFALAVVMAVTMNLTSFGRRAVAIGDNEEASRRCGVPVDRTKVGVYALCGLLVGVASVMQFARLGGSGDPTIQVGLELRAVAAAVIGGASLAGGRGSMLGTICGAILMALLDNRCTALGWPNYVQEMVVGHIIIVAVALDRWRASR